jgi:hypothetical protein
MMLSQAQTIQDQMVRWLANNTLEWICNKVVIAYFEVLSQHLPGGTEESHKMPQSASLLTDIWTQNPMNMMYQNHSVNCNVCFLPTCYVLCTCMRGYAISCTWKNYIFWDAMLWSQLTVNGLHIAQKIILYITTIVRSTNPAFTFFKTWQ